MRFAIVQGGIVANVAEADAPLAANWIEASEASPGWLYVDGVFSPPPPVPGETPSDIHIAWLRAALAEAGNLDAVDAAVASQGAVKLALWEFATTIRRDDTDVMAIAAALRIDLDATFKRADEIRRSRGR